MLNNNNIAINIFYVPFNTKKIEIAYKSKHNLTRDNQIILLMISNGENWHYLAVKSLLGLFTGVTSNHKEDYYCLNCFHSYRTKTKLDAHKKYLEIMNIDTLKCQIKIIIKLNTTKAKNQ